MGKFGIITLTENTNLYIVLIFNFNFLEINKNVGDNSSVPKDS